MTRTARLLPILLGVALNGVWPNGLAQAQSSGPSSGEPSAHARVRLVADVSAIASGRPFNVGVLFEIDPEWHIYWKYSGEAGRPTQVEWTLPAGYRAGPLVYPTPRRFLAAGDIVSFGYEGKVLITAPVTPPKDVHPGDRVKLSVNVSWLACKGLCVIGRKTVSLTLPVAASDDQVKPANASAFASARRRTPQPSGQDENVRVRTGLNVDRIRPGDRFEVGVRLSMAKGWHVQSHKPLDENLIATDLFLGGPETISLSRPIFPPGEVTERLGMKVSEYGGDVLIRVPARATADLEPGSLTIEGVLIYQACDDRGACARPRSVAISVPVVATDRAQRVSPANAEWFGGTTSGEPSEESGSVAGPDRPETPSSSGPGRGLIYLLALAFLGGLILNVMPCVLPVVSIKVLSFVQQAGAEPRRVLVLGLAFTGGMVLFFAGLGLLAMLTPVEPGWLLQRPAGVIVLTAVIFALALSLFGVFELSLPGRAASELQAAGSREGPLGAMSKGFLATVLGTSCTAPIVSGVWAAALAASDPARLLIFVTMGLGMASPYVILSAKPGWMRFLPKPGPWMDTFKQAMGFIMLVTALWLLWVLAQQVSADGVIATLASLTLLSAGLWLVGRVPPTASSLRWTITYGVAVGIVVIGGVSLWPTMTSRQRSPALAELPVGVSGDALDYATSIPWQPYAPERAEQLAVQGKVVYVDYTARWCLTCQTNKRLVLETDEVRRAMQKLGVVPIQADFTNGGDEIRRDLDRFGRSGVPLNLVYGPGLDEPIKLPELLTRGLVLEALQRASGAAPDS